jgi:hypothetical protein
MSLGSQTLLSLSFSLLAFSVGPSAHADGEQARAFFEPRTPVALVALSAGVGGFSASGARDSKGHPYGNGGIGTLGARLDLEMPSPLWLSFAGRAYFGAPPAQAEVEASVGYELRAFREVPDRGTTEYERAQLRPLLGIKAIRFADSAKQPTSAEVLALRFGADAQLLDTKGVRGFNVMRAHLVGLYDLERGHGGVEFASTAGISVDRHALGPQCLAGSRCALR